MALVPVRISAVPQADGRSRKIMVKPQGLSIGESKVRKAALLLTLGRTGNGEQPRMARERQAMKWSDGVMRVTRGILSDRRRNHNTIMTSTDQQVVAWAKESQHSFRYLEDVGYVASTPQLDVTWGSLTFLGPVLGVRLEVETNDFYMYVALFRRGRPDYDDSEYLQTCLQRLGKPAKSLNQVLAMRGDFSSHGQLVAVFATELKESLSAIESAADLLFPLL